MGFFSSKRIKVRPSRPIGMHINCLKNNELTNTLKNIKSGQYIIYVMDSDPGILMSTDNDCDKILIAENFKDAIEILVNDNDEDHMIYIIDVNGFVVYSIFNGDRNPDNIILS